MNSFEKDFNKELELATRRGSADLPVLQKWNPAGIAPPEIHVARATATNVPIESALYQLRRSPIFQQIANVLQMPLSESVLQIISKQPIDDERVQVWLFGRWWFNTYVEYLLDPLTQRSRFYKERHEEFLTLLRHMLEFQGLRRLTFRAALSAWFPDSDVLTKEAPSEDDDESDDEGAIPPKSQPAVPASAASAAAVSVAALPLPPPVAAAPQKPQTTGGRLVLRGWGGHAVRSRTRRNLSSSDRTPATGSHG